MHVTDEVSSPRFQLTDTTFEARHRSRHVKDHLARPLACQVRQCRMEQICYGSSLVIMSVHLCRTSRSSWNWTTLTTKSLSGCSDSSSTQTLAQALERTSFTSVIGNSGVFVDQTGGDVQEVAKFPIFWLG